MKEILILLCMLFSFQGFSQILNAESLRRVTDTSGWSGSVSGEFSLKRNVNDFTVIASDIHLQYKMNKHLLIFKNDLKFLKIEGEDFSNSGITHIRHNYKLNDKVAWETFGQGQYNKVSKINFRGLLGIGPRFKLGNSEKYKFYLGTLVMYEQEELLDDVTPVQRGLRGSTYLSFSLYPNDRVTIISTTYYQPLLKDFGDHRLSSQSSLIVDMFTNLAIKISYTFIYDETPAVGIPNSQYDFATGVVYTFD